MSQTAWNYPWHWFVVVVLGGAVLLPPQPVMIRAMTDSAETIGRMRNELGVSMVDGPRSVTPHGDRGHPEGTAEPLVARY